VPSLLSQIQTGGILPVHIRPAQVQDLKELVEVLSHSFHQSAALSSWLSPLLKLGISEDIRSRLQAKNPHYRCFVAILKIPDQDSKIVGTVEVSLRHRLLFKVSAPYIANLAVAKDYRRQGIARKLLLQCEKTVQEWGFSELSLHVLENNLAAQELYFQDGYRLDRVENGLGSWLFSQPRQFFLKKHWSGGT
jgi:ribosomal protein S18 acetylase RimI-like enzyme